MAAIQILYFPVSNTPANKISNLLLKGRMKILVSRSSQVAVAREASMLIVLPLWSFACMPPPPILIYKGSGKKKLYYSVSLIIIHTTIQVADFGGKRYVLHARKYGIWDVVSFPPSISFSSNQTDLVPVAYWMVSDQGISLQCRLKGSMDKRYLPPLLAGVRTLAIMPLSSSLNLFMYSLDSSFSSTLRCKAQNYMQCSSWSLTDTEYSWYDCLLHLSYIC